MIGNPGYGRMTEMLATKISAQSPTRRWITPLLITAYIVAILLISGLSRARDQQAASGPIGETFATESAQVD
ncbi:MAG: hypothetical protein J0L82_02805 [Deltaproteobacteria bacterium]|nr:hypothetical protein [Deltaproteobacteria bacterium]